MSKETTPSREKNTEGMIGGRRKAIKGVFAFLTLVAAGLSGEEAKADEAQARRDATRDKWRKILADKGIPDNQIQAFLDEKFPPSP